MHPLLTKLIKTLENQVPAHSLIGNSIFFDKTYFPWANDLEANWQVIRTELDAIMPYANDLPNFDVISPRQKKIAGDDLWKTFFFYAYGYRSQANCDRCPNTIKLIEQIPGLKVAFFSILAPGKHIPPHYGKHKGIIRYHLALKVPEPREQCRIRIEDQYACWEEGKSLIFDDTYMHEVWNDTEGYRVVLFLDVARPMRFPMSLVNWAVSQAVKLSPVIQVAKGNHESWEKQFEQLVK
jgi:ornithine lipid ester-linked acyl 2-hydroxylase